LSNNGRAAPGCPFIKLPPSIQIDLIKWGGSLFFLKSVNISSAGKLNKNAMASIPINLKPMQKKLSVLIIQEYTIHKD